MISIIIPTYNRAAVLARSLPLVLAMEGADQCEVLVVDDGSTDGTPDLLRDLAGRHSNLKPLARENGGPGEARNFALARASRDWILFLDDDIFPDPGLLSAHRARLDAGYDVSQGRMVWHEELAGEEIIQYMDAHGMQFRLDHYADGETVSYQHVYTANLALSAADARLVGGFDRAFAAKRYAFEDTAFAWRLQKAGKRIGYTPGAWARHLHPMTEEGLLTRGYTVGYGLAVASRHYPEIARDLGFDRLSRGRGLKLFLVKAALGSGLAGLAGRVFTRRLAVKRAFLSGLDDGLRDQSPE